MSRFWYQLSISLNPSDAEAVSDLFLGWGAQSVTVTYPRPNGSMIERSIRSGRPPREACTVKVLVEDDTDLAELLHRIKIILAWEKVPVYSIEPVEDQDWVRKVRESIEPIGIHGTLWIVPTWKAHGSPDDCCIALDPGQAFGTGRHPTTRLCLEWLVQTVKGGEQVLDYGCGSGILAIAALKLGAREALGVDLDPQALEVSAANARLNNVDLKLYPPETLPRLQADLVVANIYSAPLIMCASRLADAVRPGGSIALSGILSEQVNDVMEVYRNRFEFSSPRILEGWACLEGKRRGSPPGPDKNRDSSFGHKR